MAKCLFEWGDVLSHMLHIKSVTCHSAYLTTKCHMIYLKNVEIAEKYHISLGTVRNWISAAQKGKLAITLTTVSGRAHVANTAHNIMTIESLIEGRKKYRPNRSKSVLSPHPDFYRFFDQDQVYDIVTSLEVRREIPRS